MKLFSQNIKILAPCYDVIISNWVKKLKFVYYVQLVVKILKSGSITGAIRAELTYVNYVMTGDKVVKILKLDS